MAQLHIDELIRLLEEAKDMGYILVKLNTRAQVFGDVNHIEYDIAMVGKTEELKERQNKEIHDSFI